MNILWILTTQWRAQACGYAGDPNVRTPFLDSLARRSLNFSQATTPHPFGPFARAALFTGVSSPENGVRDYFDPLPENASTIATRLNGLGYHTAFFGKWHLGKRDPAAPLVGKAHAQTIIPKSARGGFSFWEGFESGFQLNDPWLHGDRLPTPTQFPGYQSNVLFDRTADWIETGATRTPWFCVVSIEPPHPPYQGAPNDEARRDFADLQLPKNVPPNSEVAEKARRELEGYYQQIEATDAALGRLFSRIDSSTTAVMFTSVHGDMHGAHGLFRKGWPHEESVRVPLLFQIPRMPAANQPAAISLQDLPMLTEELARTQRWPGFTGAVAQISMPSIVNLPHQCDRVWRGLRSAKRKLVLNADGSPWLFFDLENDPEEMDNLVDDPSRKDEIMSWTNRMKPSEINP